MKQIHKNTEIKLSLFKFPNVEEDGTGIKKVIEQNNYTNQHLHTIGKQLDRMENVINNEISKNNEKTINDKNLPLFKPFEVPKNPSNEFLKALEERKKMLKNKMKMEDLKPINRLNLKISRLKEIRI